MPYQVYTNCCHQQAFVDCSCPPDVPAYRGQHLRECAMADLGANVKCDGSSSDCCTEDHSHDQVANACDADHETHGKGVKGCAVCRPVTIVALPGAAAMTHYRMV
jgi:hypothetical protein